MGIALGVTNYGSSYATTSVFDRQVDLRSGSAPTYITQVGPNEVILAFFP